MRKKDEAFGIVPISRQAEGNHFLLIQHQAGHWGFPKGHADPGETAFATACREFEEETGIQAYRALDTVSFVEHYSFVQDQQPIDKTVTYFPAFVESTLVVCQEQEIKNYAWLPFEAAMQRISFQQAKQVLIQAHAYLNGSGAEATVS